MEHIAPASATKPMAQVGHTDVYVYTVMLQRKAERYCDNNICKCVCVLINLSSSPARRLKGLGHEIRIVLKYGLIGLGKEKVRQIFIILLTVPLNSY